MFFVTVSQAYSGHVYKSAALASRDEADEEAIALWQGLKAEGFGPSSYRVTVSGLGPIKAEPTSADKPRQYPKSFTIHKAPRIIGDMKEDFWHAHERLANEITRNLR